MVVIVDEKSAFSNLGRASNLLPNEERRYSEPLITAEEPDLQSHLEAMHNHDNDVETALASLPSPSLENRGSHEVPSEEPLDNSAQTQILENVQEAVLISAEKPLPESPNGSIISNPPIYQEHNPHKDQIRPATPPDTITDISFETTPWQTSPITPHHARDVGLRAMDYLTSQAAINNPRRSSGLLWNKDEEEEDDQEWSLASPYSVD